MTLIGLFSVLVLGYGLFLAGMALWVAHALTVPPRQKQKKTPADEGLVFSPITLTAPGGYRLRGWVVAACGPSKGTLVLCHNYKASKQKMLPWIRFLSRAGYETVSFDFNGHGESDRVHFFGNLLSRTLIDLKTVLTQLDRLPLENGFRVGLMGFSLGSLPVLGSLASDIKGSGIHAVIIDSGPPNPLVWNSRVDLVLKPAFKRLPGIRLVHLVARRLLRFSPFPDGMQSASGYLLQIDIPFFFIQGLKDHISTPDQSRWLYDRLIRAPKSYWAIPEAHHMTNLRLRKNEYQQRVLAFLDHYLAAKATLTDQQNREFSFGRFRKDKESLPVEPRS
jgi:pimeloyl-ACP methyl ester carboxylesterase